MHTMNGLDWLWWKSKPNCTGYTETDGLTQLVMDQGPETDWF